MHRLVPGDPANELMPLASDSSAAADDERVADRSDGERSDDQGGIEHEESPA